MTTKSKIIWALFAVLLTISIIIGLGIYKFNFTNDDIYLSNGSQINTYDGTYTIEGQKVTLVNGSSEIDVAPGSASKVITRYFGNDLKIDLDQDGREDLAFVLTQQSGGSGTFYYVVALLNRESGPVGTSGLLLGDRIIIENLAQGKGNILIANFKDRKIDESFATLPTVFKSIWLLLDKATLQWGEVAQNFEGEASPEKMNLGMKSWNWVNTINVDKKEIKNASPKKFSITFKKDMTFGASTDCNGVGGEYVVSGDKITFKNMMSTMMYCEGSQEQSFTKMLTETQSYMFTSKGELILKSANASAFFK